MTDESQYEGLPSSVHTEIAVLGAMLIEPMAIADAMGKLVADDFSLDSHRIIFRAIAAIAERQEPVDLVNLRVELAKRRELDAIGGPAYLFYLTEGLPPNLAVDGYATIVKEKAILRRLMSICRDGALRAADQGEDALAILSDLEKDLTEISRASASSGFVTVMDIIAEQTSTDAFLAGQTEQGSILTGFPTFDSWTNGLKGGQLVIVAGRPSMGKTAWALNAAENAAVRFGKKVGIITLEMSKEELLRRMIQSNSGVPNRRFASGSVSKDERERALGAVERFIESNLHIDDKAFTTMQEIRGKARRLHHQHGLDLLIIDYIGLVESPGKSENRTQEVSAISRGLKGLAKEMGIPVIALAQLNRKCEERSDKRPMLSDLRDSGSIEQDADIVAFVYRHEMYAPGDPDHKGKAEYIVAKQRDGQIGTIHMSYRNETTRFEDLLPA